MKFLNLFGAGHIRDFADLDAKDISAPFAPTPPLPPSSVEMGYWDQCGRGYTHSSGNLYPQTADGSRFCKVGDVVVDIASPEYAAWFSANFGNDTDGEYY